MNNVIYLTGGITKFSAKEIFRKILKVSHFSLRFSLNEECDKIKTSDRVSPEFSYSYRIPPVFEDLSPKSLTKPYENVSFQHCFCLAKMLNEVADLSYFTKVFPF